LKFKPKRNQKLMIYIWLIHNK